MAFLYRLFLVLFYIVHLIAALLNKKARLWVEGRKKRSWKNHNFSGKWIWFHCASLGEYDMAIPLMQAVKEREEDTKILVTFYSPSGMLYYHKREFQPDFADYLPFDFKRNVNPMIQHVKPQWVCLVKYEFWKHFVEKLKDSNIPVFSVNTLFRNNQVYFKTWGGFFRNTLNKIDFFYCQNEHSVNLLASIDIKNAGAFGDMRVERLKKKAEQSEPSKKLRKFAAKKKVIVLGSTWPQDEAMILPELNRMLDKIIIAPHDIRESHILELTSRLSRSYARISQWDGKTEIDILILDSIGQLTDAYSLAKWAYVGGGFSGKLHNILEPLVFKIPVVFGPKYQKFPEAIQAVELGIGKSISNEKEWHNWLSRPNFSAESFESFLGKDLQPSIGKHIFEDIIKTLTINNKRFF